MEYTVEEQKEHRKQWVAALRSGNYQKIKGRLKRDEGFCCLGVACDISNIGSWYENVNGGIQYTGTIENVNVSLIPDEVRDWLGLQSGDGAYSASSLWRDNDSYTDIKSFADIADIIESEPEGLFV